jgi:hypothetical protein
MPRKGDSPQKRQDALIALAGRGRGGAFGGNATPIVTPNTAGFLATTFTPGLAPGSLVLAADMTPLKSGLLFASALLNVTASAPDLVQFALEWVDLLTSITGGTLIAPGLHGRIGSPLVTIPVDTTNAPVAVGSKNTEVQTGANIATISFPAVPIQAVPGHRTLVALRGISSSAVITWAVGGTFSLVEG